MSLDVGSIRSEDVSGLLACVRTLSLPGTLDTLMGRVCTAVRRLIPSTSAGYGLACLQTGYAVGHMDVPELDWSDDERLFVVEHESELPYLDFVRVILKEAPLDECPQARLSSDFFSQRQFRDLAIYSVVLRPRGFEHHLALPTFRVRPGWVANLGIKRDGRPFDERERTLLSLLQPHIVRAAENSLLWTSVMAERPARDCAVLVVKDGALQDAMPPAGWRLFERHCGALPVGGLPDLVARWLRAQHSRSGPAPSRPLRVPGALGELIVRLMTRGEEDGVDFLLVQRSSLPEGVGGLTDRERDVLHWLARGKTNREIGIILGVSANTVRSHVKQILTKLGVENRTAAAGVALRLQRPNAATD